MFSSVKFGLSACGYVASVPGVDHVDVVLKTLFSLEPLVANEAEVLLDADVKAADVIGQLGLELEPRRAVVTTLQQALAAVAMVTVVVEEVRLGGGHLQV